jgi:hypothetical protein
METSEKRMRTRPKPPKKPRGFDRPAEDLPEGTPVLLVNDLGLYELTKTRSLPWKLGHGELVVMVEGRSGGYAFDRIWVASKTPERA